MNIPTLKKTLLVIFASCIGTFAAAEDKPTDKDKPTAVKLADGDITMAAPSGWKQQQPRNRIIEVEFAIPAVEGDDTDGRLTIMQAGGSVDDNIGRWIGQFSQTDGKSTRDRAVIAEEAIAGQKVHTVDISGTFADRRGPFAPAVSRKDYRMLAAIIVTKDHGQQFVKLYGPRQTIAANEKAFAGFLKSLQVKGEE